MPNPYAQYQKTQVQTASQGRLILMCYDSSIKFLRMAMEAIDQKSHETAHNHIIKVQRIINELRYSLNEKASPEIAQNLRAFYEYIGYRLIQANIKKDKEICEEVIGRLQEIRDAWEIVFRQVEELPLPKTDTGGLSVEG